MFAAADPAQAGNIRSLIAYAAVFAIAWWISKSMRRWYVFPVVVVIATLALGYYNLKYPGTFVTGQAGN